MGPVQHHQTLPQFGPARILGFMKLLQHVRCVPFPAKEKTTHCWCEFTAGGATGDAQLLFSVVPFPFER